MWEIEKDKATGYQYNENSLNAFVILEKNLIHKPKSCT